MPKVSPLQSNFGSGEMSPLLYGRVDSDRYKAGLKTCLNYIPMIQGSLVRRPGTEYVFNTKNNGVAKLQAFEFSTTQAYILEFGANYVRFFKDNANITNAQKTITGITQANPAVVTSVAHGFSNGMRIVIENVLGMTQVNNREFTVANVTANTFELSGINSTGFDAYTSGGYAAQIYEIASAYGLNDLAGLKFTQSADVLYIVHPSYPPKKLIRRAHNDWEFFDLDLQDGPYFSTNSGQNFLTPAATTGNGVTVNVGPNRVITNAVNNGSGLIRITAANHGFSEAESIYIAGVTGTTEANGTWLISYVDANNFDLRGSAFVNAYVAGGTASPALFASTDVGRLIRLGDTLPWGWAKIVSYTSPTQVAVDIKSAFGVAGPNNLYRLGLYSDTTGYPAAITFHEDRLMFGGSRGAPQRQDGSRSGDYENFAPTELSGTVNPDNAIAFSFNANDVNEIYWMASEEKGLLSGSVGGEWVTRPSSQSEALSPSNITAKKTTSWGSENVPPVQAGKSTLFVQRAGRKIRELNYYYEVDGFRAADLTQLADHVTFNGIKQMAFQKEPYGVVWAVRNDGQLLALTYDRDVESLRAGWSRHILGGKSDAAGTQSKVESVQVIPSADGKRQDAWLIVQRYVNGATVRHIEYITKMFEDTDEQRDCYFVDGGLTYDAPFTITGITQANPGVATTSSAHGFANGDKILITGVVGMTEVNSETFLVDGVTGTTFQLKTLLNANVNTTSYGAYTSGGEVRKLVSTISNLNHLEGETVSILGDGAVQPDKVVTNGKVTLAERAATVHLGYGYNSDGELLRLEAGAADGTALGKTRRMHRVGMLLHRSLGLKVGFSFTDLETVTFRTGADLLTRAPALFSGIISETVACDYDFENNFCWRQAQPLPSTILAIMPQMVTQDR